MNWRAKTENKLEHFSDWIFDNAKKTITAILVLVVIIGSQLPSLKVDTTTEGFLHKSDPMRIEYDVFRDQFGRDEKLMIAVKTKNIFDIGFLEKLDSFHHALENELPNIKAVDSLINARNTYGAEGELIVEPLIDTIPKNKEDLEKLKAVVTNNSLYENSLYSEDFTMTTVTIDTETYSSLNTPQESTSSDLDDDLGFDDDHGIDDENE